MPFIPSKSSLPAEKSSSTDNSATVTRYPTGCLGLDYRGSLFFFWCDKLSEMLEKIDSLQIDRRRVRWQERYFDGDYRDPKNYKLRRWNPNLPH